LAGAVILVGLLVLAADAGPAGADPNIMFTQRALMGFLVVLLLSVLIVLASNIMAAFTKRKQALQDIVSGCVVLRKPSS
jgi:ABC-type tungstate transport system substrate-binding protein